MASLKFSGVGTKAHTEGAASRQWVVAPDTVRALSLARSPQMSLGLARLGRIGGRTWRAPSPSGPSDRLGHGSDSSLRIGGSGRDISSRLHLAAVMSGGGVSQVRLLSKPSPSHWLLSTGCCPTVCCALAAAQ
ncbi:hypothetical protein T492DRAFT_888085 [Pavlovales sp. CCMP2436]|nr:hypothetical protein T492DRAFT_888085 [Pavlovales sp. CCMP2436]